VLNSTKKGRKIFFMAGYFGMRNVLFEPDVFCPEGLLASEIIWMNVL
jgi:hypothetical protein